jgi:hypothetical protein
MCRAASDFADSDSVVEYGLWHAGCARLYGYPRMTLIYAD